MIITKVCPHCKEEKNISEFYLRRNKKDKSPYCKICTNIQTVVRQRAMKQKAVEYKGGKCNICGYDKSIAALEFHHIDPTKKDFSISNFKSYSFSKIKTELDKCILVCANCHREIHSNLTEIPKEKLIWNPVKEQDNEPLDSYQKPVSKTKIEWPSNEEMKDLVWKYPRVYLSKLLKVSDVAISKYLKRRNILQPPRGYWSKISRST
jgi:hypothetical protein